MVEDLWPNFVAEVKAIKINNLRNVAELAWQNLAELDRTQLAELGRGAERAPTVSVEMSRHGDCYNHNQLSRFVLFPQNLFALS